MASDVNLFIFDPRVNAMACVRWLGSGLARDKARELLRIPTVSDVGHECWSDVDVVAVQAIAGTGHADGATPPEIAELADRYPPGPYWWLVEHGY